MRGKKEIKSRTKVTKNVLVFTGAMAVALLVQEYYVRVALPQSDPSGYLKFVDGRNSGPRLWIAGTMQRQISNTGDFDVTVTFNQYSLQNIKDVGSSSESNIYVMGDSFAFRWGVEEPHS